MYRGRFGISGWVFKRVYSLVGGRFLGCDARKINEFRGGVVGMCVNVVLMVYRVMAYWQFRR